MLNDKVYDVLKWITLIVLPACGSLYFGLSGIWGFPHGEEIVGSISVICLFLGSILGISTGQYNALPYDYDGQLELTQDAGGTELSNLVLNKPSDDMEDGEEIVLNVKKEFR